MDAGKVILYKGDDHRSLCASVGGLDIEFVLQPIDLLKSLLYFKKIKVSVVFSYNIQFKPFLRNTLMQSRDDMQIYKLRCDSAKFKELFRRNARTNVEKVVYSLRKLA